MTDDWRSAERTCPSCGATGMQWDDNAFELTGGCIRCGWYRFTCVACGHTFDRLSPWADRDDDIPSHVRARHER